MNNTIEQGIPAPTQGADASEYPFTPDVARKQAEVAAAPRKAPTPQEPPLTPHPQLEKTERIATAVAGLIGAAGPGVASTAEVLKAAQNQPPAIVEQYVGKYDLNKPFKLEVPATAIPVTAEMKEQQIQVQPATEVYSLTLSTDQNKEVLADLGKYGKEIAAKEGDPSIRVFRVPVNYDRSKVQNPADMHLPLAVDPKTGQPYTQELSYFLAGIPGQFTQGGIIDAVYTGQQQPDGSMKWSAIFQVMEDNKVFNMHKGALIFMDSTTKVTDPNKPVNIVNVDNNVEGLTLTTTIATQYFLDGARWVNPDVFQNVQPGDQLVVYIDSNIWIRQMVSGTPTTGIIINKFQLGIQTPQDGGIQETTGLNGEKAPITVTEVPVNKNATTAAIGGIGTDLSQYQTTPEALAAAGSARILTPKELGGFASGIEIKFADGRKFTIKTDLPNFVYTDQVKVMLFHEELQQMGILDLHKKNFEVIIANGDKKAYGPAGNWINWMDDKGEFEAIGYVNKVTDKGDRMQYVVYWTSRYVEALKTDKRSWMLQSAGNSVVFYAILEHQVGIQGMMTKFDQVVGGFERNPFKLEYK